MKTVRQAVIDPRLEQVGYIVAEFGALTELVTFLLGFFTSITLARYAAPRPAFLI